MSYPCMDRIDKKQPSWLNNPITSIMWYLLAWKTHEQHTWGWWVNFFQGRDIRNMGGIYGRHDC